MEHMLNVKMLITKHSIKNVNIVNPNERTQ